MMILAATFFAVCLLGSGMAVGFVLRQPGKAAAPHAPFPRLPLPVKWTVEDCLQLAKFLKSPTGQNFIERARAVALANAATACENPLNVSHSAGIAHGMTEMIRWQQSLASDEMFSRLTGDQVKQPHAAEEVNDFQSAETRSFN